jgi:hypothetical protein
MIPVFVGNPLRNVVGRTEFVATTRNDGDGQLSRVQEHSCLARSFLLSKSAVSPACSNRVKTAPTRLFNNAERL